MGRVLPWLLLTCNLAIAGLLAWSCGGTLPGPPVCSPRSACKKGYACVMGRCRRDKTLPTVTRSTRRSFQPVDLAYVDGDGKHGPADLGPSFRLGARGAEVKLIMRFALDLEPVDEVQRALLVMEPLERCERSAGYARVDIAHVLAKWSSPEIGPSRFPRSGLPMWAGDHAITPPGPLRIDVTELVREWRRHRSRYHGLLLTVTGSSSSGGCYSTGVVVGRGPRIDVYLRPDLPEADKADAGDAGDAGKRGDAGDAGAGDAGADGGKKPVKPKPKASGDETPDDEDE